MAPAAACCRVQSAVTGQEPSFASLFPMLILEFPVEKHHSAYDDMVHEWRIAEKPTSPGKLFAGKDFDEFLAIVQRETTESDPAKVPSHLYFLADMDSSKLLGAIQIRHHINHPNLIETGGYIGYGIRPSERRKGYATKMLGLAISEAKNIGLSDLLVTC